MAGGHEWKCFPQIGIKPENELHVFGIQQSKTIQLSSMVTDALNILEDFSITQLIVTDQEEYKGVLHLHDILKEGIV